MSDNSFEPNRSQRPLIAIATIFAALLLAGPLMVGCSVPEGGPETPTSAHYRLVNARSAGDMDALWSQLHPKTKKGFERWHNAEKKTVAILEVAPYSPEDKADALKKLEGGRRAKLAGGQALFASFVGAIEGFEMGTMMGSGAQVRSVVIDGGKARVRTWAGDETHFVQSGDTWYAALPGSVDQEVRAAATRAEANLKMVQANIDRLQSPGQN